MEQHEVWMAQLHNAKIRADKLRAEWEEEQETIRSLVIQLYRLSPLSRRAIAEASGFSETWVNRLLRGVVAERKKRRVPQPPS